MISICNQNSKELTGKKIEIGLSDARVNSAVNLKM